MRTKHNSRLEAFKSWLNDNGIAHRPGKGDYQVLQVITANHGWRVVFKRNDMPEHYTVNEKLLPLVRQFIKETRA